MMPPRGRMGMPRQEMRNPFGMRQQQGMGSPFGMRQPQGMRNPFGNGPQQAPPFQMGLRNGNRMSFNRMNRPQGKGRGGLLSKFLKKGDSTNPSSGILQQFTRGNINGSAGSDRSLQGSGSMIQSILNPGNVNSFLSNTQQVLKSAQQFGPIIQQYGPMVKNIPSLWRLYQGFKDFSSEETSTEGTSDVEVSESVDINEKTPIKKKKKKKISKESEVAKDNNSTAPASSSQAGSSTPKLYI